MASTCIWPVKTRLDHLVDYVSNQEKTIGLKTVIDYATNEEKTLEKEYVSYLNCSMFDPYNSMVNTKNLFKDESEILAFHGYQSFDAGEVDADKAHEIGVEFASKMWGDRFEVIVTTHLNTEHIHNHFLINSTSFVDGKRYYNTYKDIYKMREVSDEICLNQGLSVIEKTKGNKKKEYYQSKPLRELAKETIDHSIHISLTFKQFEREMELMGFVVAGDGDGYKIKHITSSKYIRVKSLGNRYTYDKIRERIQKRDEFEDVYERKGFDTTPWLRKYKRKQLTGFQKLVIHYQFMLGILPKNNTRKFKVPKEYREAMKHINDISKQTIFICKNDIETLDDLHNYMANIEKTMEQVIDKRTKLYNQIRRCNDEGLKKSMKDMTRELSNKMADLRNEYKLCERIEDRALNMEQTVNRLEDVKKKDVKGYER